MDVKYPGTVQELKTWNFAGWKKFQFIRELYLADLLME